MATHDYVIANASGAAVRADLNNALAAIVTNNSNATEPATTYAYMWWYDTTAGQLKQRNAADDGWVVVPQFDSGNRLLIGTSSSSQVGAGLDAALQVESTSQAGCRFSILRRSPSDVGPTIAFGKSGGSGDQVVANGDSLGTIDFSGGDGTDVKTSAARIQCEVDGVPGLNDMPGRLVFFNTANGQSSPTESLKIDNVGRLYSVPTYDNTTGSTTNYMRIGANGEMYRSTSSIAHKTDVEDMDDAYADAILNLRPVWYRSTCKGDNPNHSHWGFIAEEVEQIDPRLCSFRDYETSIDEKGSQVATPLDTPVVDGVDYASLTPLLLNLVKRQQQAIETLEAKVAVLEAN